MKTIYLLIAVLLFTQHSLDTVQDTTARAPSAARASRALVDSVKIKLDILKKDAEILKATSKSVKDTVDAIAKKAMAKPSCIGQSFQPNDWGFWQWALVFLPVFIFIIVIGILVFAGLKDFDIAEALKENELTKVTIPNPFYTGQQAATGQTDVPLTLEITANVKYIPAVPANLALIPPILASDARYEINDADKIYRPSISRYIALISSLLIIIIAVCLSSFFIYHYLRTGCPPELGALTTVLIALGISIVPYAANKVSTAVAGKSSENTN